MGITSLFPTPHTVFTGWGGGGGGGGGITSLFPTPHTVFTGSKGVGGGGGEILAKGGELPPLHNEALHWML